MVDEFQGFSSKKLFEFDMKKKVGGGEKFGRRGKNHNLVGVQKPPAQKKKQLVFCLEGLFGELSACSPQFCFGFYDQICQKKQLELPTTVVQTKKILNCKNKGH